MDSAAPAPMVRGAVNWSRPRTMGGPSPCSVEYTTSTVLTGVSLPPRNALRPLAWEQNKVAWARVRVASGLQAR